MEDNVEGVYFDAVGMDIASIVQEYKTGTSYGTKFPVTFNTTLTNPKLGYSLGVKLHEPANRGDQIFLNITYKTNDKSTAVSWLTKDQTHDKTKTYLYSQCEDIACRSIAPLQDTPANKFNYTADITVETGFIVKMSANDTGSVVDNTTGMTTFSFSC